MPWGFSDGWLLVLKALEPLLVVIMAKRATSLTETCSLTSIYYVSSLCMFCTWGHTSAHRTKHTATRTLGIPEC